MNVKWEQRKLKDISIIIAGGDKNKDKLKKIGNYPVIANAVNSDGVVGYYDDSYRIEAPAITVTGRGDIGHATPRYLNFTPVVRLLALKTKHNVLFLANAINKITIFNESTGVPQLTKPQLSKYSVKVTKLNEEKKISKIINTLNKLVTLQQRKLEQFKQLKKVMLQYLLTTEKKSAPLIRNKNYNNKWDTTTFSKLLNYERPENYIVTNTNYRKNGIPVLTANKSFILGYTNESNVYNKGEAIIFDDFTLENKFVNFPFMIKSSAIKILTSKVNYSLYFIFQLLQHTKFIKEGHARHYISVVQKQIVKIPPSYEEQESISDTFSRIQSLIKLQQNKIDQHTTLKKYLLQKMFI
ncbi:restriction endonuclease subunit S [Limosilactobacillus reuteri]|nr:restriction endonuclease subunit S [Limosilactobacillus reuteri]